MRLRRFKDTSLYSAICLSDAGKVPRELQYLRVGKFNHPKYGEFEITSNILSEMIANFDAKIRGVDICFDYFHNSDQEASGWPEKFELRENKTELWAIGIDWTPTAERKLAEREIRYFSPDFTFKWQDPETGKVFNNVIFGGGLTNRPFVKEMQAIVADETEGDEMELKEALAKIMELEAALKLSETKLAEQGALLEKTVHTKHAPAAAVVPAADGEKPAVKADDNNASGDEGGEVAALKKQIADLQGQLAQSQGDGEKVMGEKKKLEEAMAMSEKEKEFGLLLTEGKACAAQKDAFIKGDMKAFIKLAEKVNLDAKGSGGGGEETNTGKEFDDKVLKLAEDKVKADPKLKKHEAIQLAHKELRAK